VRTLAVGVLSAFCAAGVACGSASPPPPPSVSLAPAVVRPAGAQDITSIPPAPDVSCDAEASWRPVAEPQGPALDAIKKRGRLIVGVDQNTFRFGFRDPSSGRLEGFDIDIARELARDLFGDPDRVEFQVVDASQRESALRSGQVDAVVRTFSMTCERERVVDFSTVYFHAQQRVLARRSLDVTVPESLSGKRVCAVVGTTSLVRLAALTPRPSLTGVTSWTDCLLMLQQSQIDAISTDDVVLAGLAAQDPSVELKGPSLGVEPYGVGVKKGNQALVRFVNATLERLRRDGTWERLYARWLGDLGPSPGPPAARYRDEP
jgi:polar amino acid transport system substrate-binding protein